MIDNISSVEQTVIGQILLFGEPALTVAEEYVGLEDFNDDNCKEIFHACQEIIAKQKKIDIVMLERQLGEKYRVMLVRLAESAVKLSKNTFRDNLRMMRDDGKERRVHDSVFSIIAGEYEDLDECRKILTDALQHLDNVGDSKGVEAKDGYIDLLSRADNPPQYTETGMAKVDKYLMIEPGDFIVVGGRPSAGKTAFTLQMMLTISKRQRVVYFSLETREDKLFNRLISNYTEIPLNTLKYNPFGDWQNQLTRGYDDFAKLNFKVVNAAGWTVSQIYAKARQEKAELIFVDYLGLIRGKGNSQYEKATNISNDMHTMSQRTKISTFALCQLNRDGKATPDMTSLRDSGAIEQDADAIMLLSIPENGDKEKDRTLNIVKNKEGSCGAIAYRFEGKCQRFHELEVR